MPGKVTCRPIHASTLNPFEGISRWFHNRLQPVIRKFKHLAFSSDEVINLSRRQRLSRDCVLVHVDIDDFYMVGSKGHLGHHSSRLVGDETGKRLCKDVVSFLLDQQIIKSSTLPDSLFKVVEGSSQGAIHSPSIAVAAFVHSECLNGSGLTTRGFKERFHVETFIEYIDNLLSLAVYRVQRM